MSNKETDKGHREEAGDGSTGRSIDKTVEWHSHSLSEREPCDSAGNSEAAARFTMPTEDLLDFSRKLMSQDPSSHLFVPIAEEFCARKLWREAVETCRRGLVYHPRQFRGRVLLGWALWESGEVEEAECLLREARAELEKNAVIYRILAELAERKGDSDQAWRLMHLYHSLQDGDLHRKASPQASQEEASVQGAQKTQGASLMDVLSSLLMKFAEQQPASPRATHLFSETDRNLLREIINAGKS